MISYLTGDATACNDPGVIAHVCNDAGGWGAGFTAALSARWPEPERAYRTYPAARFPGQVQLVPVSPVLSVANLVAQHGYRSPGNPVPLDYGALARCLAVLASMLAPGTEIRMPRIGCGLGGGSWGRVGLLIREHLAGFDVRVYDLPGSMGRRAGWPRTP